MKKQKYTEEQIREILSTAYRGKTTEEIEAMVKETMAQYLAEEKKTRKASDKETKDPSS